MLVATSCRFWDIQFTFVFSWLHYFYPLNCVYVMLAPHTHNAMWQASVLVLDSSNRPLILWWKHTVSQSQYSAVGVWVSPARLQRGSVWSLTYSPQHGHPRWGSYCSAHTSNRTCANPSPVMTLSQLGDEKERERLIFTLFHKKI